MECCLGEVPVVICITILAVFPPFGGSLFESVGMIDPVPLDVNLRETYDINVIGGNGLSKSSVFDMRGVFW